MNNTIEIQGVKITLTKEQLAEIAKQQKQDIFTATTYEEVCKRLKQGLVTDEDFNEDLDKNTIKKLIAFAKIKQLEEYFNENWKPNWNDINEYKYYPYFKYNSGGGVGFNCSSYCCNSFFGQPGIYKTIKISDFIGKYFINIYKDLL